jgi:hypothetical protein
VAFLAALYDSLARVDSAWNTLSKIAGIFVMVSLFISILK